jgi:hypothetical protein
LSGYLNNSIECNFNEIDENNNSISSITKKWPELENELEFSRYCINQVDLSINQDNDERSERMVIQKQNALAFELWISELVIILCLFFNLNKFIWFIDFSVAFYPE